MLEMSPDRTFGVLSPAFKGNERTFALDLYAACSCTFLHEGLCQLHETGLQLLECRHCHHDRPGAGPRCHADLERDWNSSAGRALVVRWSRGVGLWDRLGTAHKSGR